MSDPTTCMAREGSCRCRLPAEHPEPVHECEDQEVCGGAWSYDPSGGLVVSRLPGLVMMPDGIALIASRAMIADEVWGPITEALHGLR